MPHTLSDIANKIGNALRSLLVAASLQIFSMTVHEAGTKAELVSRFAPLGYRGVHGLTLLTGGLSCFMSRCIFAVSMNVVMKENMGPSPSFVNLGMVLCS